MNGFAIKVGELILWEMKATPWILYLKPLKRIKNIIFDIKTTKTHYFMGSGVSGVKHIDNINCIKVPRGLIAPRTGSGKHFLKKFISHRSSVAETRSKHTAATMRIQ